MNPRHRRKIELTLAALIEVQPDEGKDILMAKPAFWRRCALIPIDTKRIFVDGYLVACNWNCWRVTQMYPQHHLSVFQGYALSNIDGRWLEHCWLMTGHRLIETTGEFSLYFGAALNEKELATFNDAALKYKPEDYHKGLYWKSRGYARYYVELDDNFSLGRTRSLASGEPEDDLFGGHVGN
jgi:hypothetical protein